MNRSLQSAANDFRNVSVRIWTQRRLEQVHGFGFRLAPVWSKSSFARAGLSPAGSYRQYLFMQTRRARAIERKSPKQDDARNCVGSLSQARTRQIVMTEPCCHKTAEQALYHSVFQVKLHDVVVNSFRRRENHRAQRRLPTPFKVAFAVFGRDAQRIQRGGRTGSELPRAEPG